MPVSDTDEIKDGIVEVVEFHLVKVDDHVGLVVEEQLNLGQRLAFVFDHRNVFDVFYIEVPFFLIVFVFDFFGGERQEIVVIVESRGYFANDGEQTTDTSPDDESEEIDVVSEIDKSVYGGDGEIDQYLQKQLGSMVSIR